MGENTQKDTPTNYCKKRVNISISPHLHDEAHDFAENHGTNFSQLVTQAIIEYMESPTESSDSGEIQSVIERLDILQQEIKQNSESLEQQRELIEWVTGELGPNGEQFASQIENELNEAAQPLSIPDLTERLSIPPHEIEAGLQYLEDRFAVKRIETTNLETDVPRWKIP